MDVQAPSTSLSVTTPSAREIRTEREFDAPRERVWRALTEPNLLARWWGGESHLVVERLEAVPGGLWRFVEHAPEGAHRLEGRFREVSPPERLVQTFEWEGMPGSFVVDTTTLDDLGDGRTRLVTVSLFDTVDERDRELSGGMAVGLEESYRALDALLAADEGGSRPTTTAAGDELAIRHLLDAWTQAIRDGDLDGVLAHHTPDVVVFDVAPPLQRKGLDAYVAAWEPFLREGPHERFALDEMRLVVGDTAAFCHALLRVGEEPDFAIRMTLGLVKVRGRWLIAHEHHSAPIEAS